MSEREMHFDVETRSTIDLQKVGADVYFDHPTTDLWCFAYAFDDDPPEAWWRGQPLPEEVAEHLANGGVVVAHNAGFEWLAINKILAKRHGWPTIPFSQMRCTAAMAATMALPRPLGDLGAALGLNVQKDETGRRLMLMMTKPRRMEGGQPVWWDEPSKLQRLVDYCVTDVLTEREAEKKLRPLSPNEHKVWQLDHVINQRGVYVDEKSVRLAKLVVTDKLEALQKELQLLTDYAVTSVSEIKRMTSWLQSQGLDVASLDKKAVSDALAVVQDPKLRRVLEIRQEAGRASVAKLDSFLAGRSADGRLRGLLMYHGAGTGRWTGMRLQPQNFPRPEEWWDEDVSNAYFELLERRKYQDIDIMFGSTIRATSNALRNFITAAPGNILYGGDFSNIEGRGLAWLAKEEWKLNAFRDFDKGIGPDLYKVTAANILTITTGVKRTPADVTKLERQNFGKVPELACGYQGGVNAFQTMAKNYNLSFKDEDADTIKSAWREAHPNIRSLWYDLERTAFHAVLNPGKIFQVCDLDFSRDRYQRVEYCSKGNVLWCRLPGGRLLAYMDPKIRKVMTPWGEEKDAVTYMGVDSVTRQWKRFAAYGGLYAENIVQAISRDVLVYAMFRLECGAYPIVLTVHDEVISETKADFGSVEEFTALMSEAPPWAASLPIKVEAERFFRYRK